MEKAISMDPTVYEYDNIYDDLQAKKAVSDKRLAPDVERKVRVYKFSCIPVGFVLVVYNWNLWSVLELLCEYVFVHSYYKL